MILILQTPLPWCQTINLEAQSLLVLILEQKSVHQTN